MRHDAHAIKTTRMADGHYYSLPRKAVTLLRWCAAIIIRTCLT
jgi:hypothetical protein